MCWSVLSAAVGDASSACIQSLRIRLMLPVVQATKPEEASRSYERHFDHRDELMSRIT